MYDSNNQFNFWESKFVLASVVLVAIFLLFYVGKTFYIKYQINKEISTISQDIEKSQEKETELQKMVENLTDKDFLEREARLKLNLKKPGEEVIMIVNASEDPSSAKAAEGKEEAGVQSKSQNNLKKWIETIF